TIERLAIDAAIWGRSLNLYAESVSGVTGLSSFELRDQIGRHTPASIRFAFGQAVSLQPIQPTHVRGNQVSRRRRSLGLAARHRLKGALVHHGIVHAAMILREAGDSVIARLDPLLDDAADPHRFTDADLGRDLRPHRDVPREIRL